MRPPTIRRRTLFVVLAPIIGVLAALALVAGCTSSGGAKSSGAGGEAFAASGRSAGAASSAAAAPTAAAPIAGDQNAASQKAADSSSLNLGSTAQIKTADMTIAAKNVTAAATSAIQFATGAGGGVSADVRTAASSDDPSSGSAQLTLKVLPDQLESTLARLAGLGTERSRQSSSQDVTGQVADVSSRVASAQASIARLQVLFSKASAVGDIVAIEGQLAQREADLEALQAQQRALTAQTSFATIAVDIVALTAPVTKTKPADRSGFVGGLSNGWHAFTKALGWGLTGIGAVLPFAIVLALLVGAARWWRRRHSRPGIVQQQDHVAIVD
jgi:hypothetical protein